MTIFFGCDGNVPISGPYIDRFSFYGKDYKFAVSNVKDGFVQSKMIQSAFTKMIHTLTLLNDDLEEVVIMTWGGREYKLMSEALDVSDTLPVFPLTIVDLQAVLFRTKTEQKALKEAYRAIFNTNITPTGDTADMLDAKRIYKIKEKINTRGVPKKFRSNLTEELINTLKLNPKIKEIAFR